MQSIQSIHTNVVLLGGGHAHVEVMRQFAMQPPPGVRLTLVTRDVLTPYSGMLPGHIAGHYSVDESHIDLRRLARVCGARLLHLEANGLDCDNKRIFFEHRPPLHFDILSIDIGSSPGLDAIEGADSFVLPVKPVDQFLQRWPELESFAGVDALAGGDSPAINPQHADHTSKRRIVVIGAGAGGVELALSVDHRLRQLSNDRVATTVTVIAGERVLPGHSQRVRDYLLQALAERSIAIITGKYAQAIDAHNVTLSDGVQVGYDFCIGVTSASPAKWLTQTALTLDADGFIRTNANLQSLSHQSIFAAGDVCRIDGTNLPRAGVYAVRQGPVLAANIRALLAANPLTPYRPQKHALALISTGDQCAIASRGALAIKGRWLWHVKDWIDRRWMQRYQQLMMPMSEDGGIDEMRCGGCAAKVSRHTLERVLTEVHSLARTQGDVPCSGKGTATDRGIASAPPEIVLGLGERDDASALQPPDGALLVQSVDQYRSFIDDPWLFGQITTEHCMNDVIAMGATPHSALAAVTVPFAESGAIDDDLSVLLHSVTLALKASGAVLIGGHTAEASELSLGLTVNGFVAPDRLLTNAGMQDDSCLLLTKPIGSGVVIAADAAGDLPVSTLNASLQTMRCANLPALSVLRRHGVQALTDVSGFGLIGHLSEMLLASEKSARLEAANIPMIDGVELLFSKGFRSSLQSANEQSNARYVADRAAVLQQWPVLFDPQTSGPLLACLPQAQANECLNALIDAGYEQAAIIGVVEAPTGPTPIRFV